MDEPLDLQSAVKQLEQAIEQTPIRGDHLIPDLVAVGLARDVLENAKATLQISSSEVPRALYPSARAAFEAVFELIVLVRGSDYDSAGCHARAAELVETGRSRRLAQDVLRAMGQPEDADKIEPSLALEAAVEQEAAGWDELAPGRGDALRNAYTAIDAARQRKQPYWHNWFATSRSQLQKNASSLVGGGPETAKLIESWYQLLSMQSHPAPRIDSHNLQWLDDGTFAFGTPPDQKEFSVGMGVGAAQVAARIAAIILGDLQNQAEVS